MPKFAREMVDSEWLKFVSKVSKSTDKKIFQGLRKGLKNCVVVYNTDSLIFAFFTGVKFEAAGICDGWTDYLKSILTNDKWKSLPLNTKIPGKINFKPPLNKSKIPLIKKGPNKGILDEFGNEWNWDLLHKDHYDVTLPNGKHFGVYPDGTFKASKEVPKPPTKIVN